MKSRLGAALSPLFTGPHRRNSSQAISAIPRFTLFKGDGHSNRTLVSLQVLGINSQKQSLHSFANDEDDFSELGLPVKQGAGKLLKLVTEKPEPYGTRKIDAVKKLFSGMPLPAESSSRTKDFTHSRVRTSEAVTKVETRNDSSKNTVDKKSGNPRKGYTYVVDDSLELGSEGGSKLSEVKGSYGTKSTSVTVEDVPSTVGLSQLIEAISVFGEISSASMKTACNGLGCFIVRFERVDSRRRAVSAGGITVKGFHLSIRPLDVPDTVAIKIKNISFETADSAIHSACMSFGSLEGLARTKEDTVDAIYNVKDDWESQSILEKLNDTITDGHRWSAHLLARDSTNNEDAKCKLGLQISSHLAELKRQVYMKRIEAEDLEYLHSSIVHLEETPCLESITK